MGKIITKKILARIAGRSVVMSAEDIAAKPYFVLP